MKAGIREVGITDMQIYENLKDDIILLFQKNSDGRSHLFLWINHDTMQSD